MVGGWLDNLYEQLAELKEENDSLIQELGDAHQKLTDYGIGKEHWSLAGRIDHALEWYEIGTLMPKSNQRVLVRHEDGNIYIMTYKSMFDVNSPTFSGYKYHFETESGTKVYNGVTHWKSLPYLPIDD